MAQPAAGKTKLGQSMNLMHGNPRRLTRGRLGRAFVLLMLAAFATGCTSWRDYVQNGFNADFRGAKFDDSFRVRRPGFLGVFLVSAADLSSSFRRGTARSAFSTGSAGAASGARFAGVFEEFGLGRESADVSYWRPRKGKNG